MNSIEMNITGVILCGGKGTRLHSVVSDRPKPMAEVAGKPFLDYLIFNLVDNGIKQIILSTGFMSGFIRKYYAGKDMGAEIIISEEKEPLGTAGALKLAEPLIKSDPFFVLNGDSICFERLEVILNFHLLKNAEITILLSRAENTADYGSISLNNNSRITGFAEKRHSSGSGLVNAGVYVFSKNALTALPACKSLSLEHDVFTASEKIYGVATENDFIDIGTAERYISAGKFLKNQ
ncbi:MAG: nucleotidyltransferase family protein [Elusimicrobiota bacterium]